MATFHDRMGDENSRHAHVPRQRLVATVQRVNLRTNEQAQLVDFFNVLTDTDPNKTVLTSIPGKLSPGSNIR